MKQNHLIAGCIGVIVVIAGWLVYDARVTMDTLRTELFTYADVQLQAVLDVADTLRQTNAPEGVLTGVVSDCVTEDRARLDELLGRLSEISRTDLIELDGLYRQCGAYFAQQRALKVHIMSLEVEQLLTFYDTLAELTDEEITLTRERLSQLVSLEASSAQLSMQLVDIQGDIIEALIAGARPDSDEVLLLLGTAQEARENLQFNTQEARAIRSQLSS